MSPNTLQQELNLSRRACCYVNAVNVCESEEKQSPSLARLSVARKDSSVARSGGGCSRYWSRRRTLDLALLVLLGVLLFSFPASVTARPNGTATWQVAVESQVNAIDSNIIPPSDPNSLVDNNFIVTAKSGIEDESLKTEPGKMEGNDHKAESGHGFEVFHMDFSRVEIPFIIGVWILSASIAKIGFHMTPKLHLIFPESCLLIVVGVIIGVILYSATDLNMQPLTPDTFFFFMLPPIILDAGYFMPNRMFFDNIGTILLMAVVGTIFNIATIGSSLWACGLTGIYNIPILDTFLFASLISAVDPVAVLAVFEEIHVNEVLYIVVFGESLLNDAVTVVLYHMFENFGQIGVDHIMAVDIVKGVGSFFVVALGGTVIGVIWGFLTGLVTRFTDHVRVIEPIFIFVMAYLAYLNAEIFHMSGILAITFCGITMKNYVEANISHKSHTTIKYALKMLSSSSETIIFMFLGVATVKSDHDWNTWFVILTILFCSFFRVIGVVLLTWIANRFRIHKLSNVDQFVMSYGGLRGAVAFALVLLIDKERVPAQPIFVTTTIAVIYFTVFLQGITIKPLVKLLRVKRAEKRKPTMNERIHQRCIDHMMAGLEDVVGKTGNYTVRDKFKRFDNRFIRPYLIRDLQGAEPKIIETYSKLTMRDAIEVMRRNPSTLGQMTNNESMSALFRNYTFAGSPSFSNLENSSRNLDMQELDYNPSKKDLTDAKIHHLLAEELKPRRHRRLSYSRHAVDDRDLSTQVNYKMHMNIRRMVNDRKKSKRSKRGNKEAPKNPNQVSFAEFQQNGSAKQFSNDYVHNVLQEDNEDEAPQKSSPNDDWDDGLTFTAKSTQGEANDSDDAPMEIADKRKSNVSGDRPSTPTATETVLPWKRQDDEGLVLKQNEFPAWASNKEYLAYNSPSATFLGGLTKPKAAKSVIGLFRRESRESGSDTSSIIADGGATPTGTPTNRFQDKRSQSVCVGMLQDSAAFRPAAPFAVTASHRRNNRRGSALENAGGSIPEEKSVLPPMTEVPTDSAAELSADDDDAHILSPLLDDGPPLQITKTNGGRGSSGTRPVSIGKDVRSIHKNGESSSSPMEMRHLMGANSKSKAITISNGRSNLYSNSQGASLLDRNGSVEDTRRRRRNQKITIGSSESSSNSEDNSEADAEECESNLKFS